MTHRGYGRDLGTTRAAKLSALRRTLNIDFVNEALGPGARVAVELSVEGTRRLVKTIEAVLAQAEQRGVLADVPVAAASAQRPATE